MILYLNRMNDMLEVSLLFLSFLFPSLSIRRICELPDLIKEVIGIYVLIVIVQIEGFLHKYVQNSSRE